MALTLQQINENVDAMKSQGAPDSDIQAYLDGVGKVDSTTGTVQSSWKDKFKDVFNTVADTSNKVLGGLADATVNPIGRALTQPFVSMYGGLKELTTGKKLKGPVKTPWGDVSSDPSAGELGKQAFDVATTALPVEKLAAPALEVASKLAAPVLKRAKMILPPVEKVAEFLTNESSRVYEFAKNNKSVVKRMMDIAEDPAVVPGMGKKIFDIAKKTAKTATKDWSDAEGQIMEIAKDKLDEGMELVRQNSDAIFKKEGISVSGGKKLAGEPTLVPLDKAGKPIKANVKGVAKKTVDLGRSAFTKDPTAETAFGRLVDIINEPSTQIEHLLNKRSAITALEKGLPKDATNVRRVVKSVVESFDTVLDDLTGGVASNLRGGYAEKAGPAKKIIKEMTDGQGQFSADKASQFINQLASDVKFDSADLVKKLQNVSGTGENLLQDAKALGVARKINKIAPNTGSRLKDVVFSYGIGKIPLLSALVSPKFWAHQLVEEGGSLTPAILRRATIKAKQVEKELIDPVSKIFLQRLIISKFQDAEQYHSNNNQPQE